jgi:RNA polymerase sigma-70 factor (ECF subfamily)
MMAEPAAGRHRMAEGSATVDDRQQRAAFVAAVAPHLRAAYGLARWLLGNDADAEDAAQDAYVRAYRHFDGFGGANPRAWLLAIARRCCYSLIARKRPAELGSFDEEVHAPAHAQRLDGPEQAALRADDARRLNAAVAALAVEQREVFVLRELEGLSYKEIADVAGVPIGTVMSRLSRARAQLQRALGAQGETP